MPAHLFRLQLPRHERPIVSVAINRISPTIKKRSTRAALPYEPVRATTTLTVAVPSRTCRARKLRRCQRMTPHGPSESCARRATRQSLRSAQHNAITIAMIHACTSSAKSRRHRHDPDHRTNDNNRVLCLNQIGEPFQKECTQARDKLNARKMDNRKVGLGPRKSSCSRNALDAKITV